MDFSSEDLSEEGTSALCSFTVGKAFISVKESVRGGMSQGGEEARIRAAAPGKVSSPGDEGPAPRFRPANGDEDCRSSLGAVPDHWSPSPASSSRGPHHRHDPSPDRMGQAVPDGSQLGHFRRDRHGRHESSQSVGLVGCGSGYAPARDGTASPPSPLACGHQASRPSTIARMRRRSSAVSEPQASIRRARSAGSAPDFARAIPPTAVFPGVEVARSNRVAPTFAISQFCRANHLSMVGSALRGRANKRDENGIVPFASRFFRRRTLSMGRRHCGALPAMRLHRQSGQARIRLNGTEYRLGQHGSPAARLR